ncbi:MAG: hypothetical protein ACI9HK_004831 [Pirellulaceae bacterium]|jgi:hypothetical protein
MSSFSENRANLAAALKADKLKEQGLLKTLEEQRGRTRVVMSFGTREGGAFFAAWLRNEIIRFKGYTDDNSVYLDSVALQNAPGIRKQVVPGTTVMVVDPSSRWETGVASLNMRWRLYYQNAMSQAHTMIFVGTPAWCASEWCRMELDFFADENRHRNADNKQLLKGIALIFPGCTEAFSGMTHVVARCESISRPTSKTMVVAGKSGMTELGSAIKARDMSIPDYYTMHGQALLQLMSRISR